MEAWTMMQITLGRLIGCLPFAALLFAVMPEAAQAGLICSAGNILGAGSCVETVTTGPGATEFTNAPIGLDKWSSNAQVGFVETLTDAQFVFTGTLFVNGSAMNNGSPGSVASFTVTFPETFTFAAGAGAPSNFLSSNQQLSSVLGFTNVNVAAQTSTSLSGSVSVTSLPLVITTGLAQYIGAGTFQTLLSTLTGTTINGGGGLITVNSANTVSGQVNVVYHFNNAVLVSTPEPASIFLLMSGLTGLGALRRFRRA